MSRASAAATATTINVYGMTPDAANASTIPCVAAVTLRH
jgi:hypothetical protein